jgi:hypothetical protein
MFAGNRLQQEAAGTEPVLHEPLPMEASLPPLGATDKSGRHVPGAQSSKRPRPSANDAAQAAAASLLTPMCCESQEPAPYSFGVPPAMPPVQDFGVLPGVAAALCGLARAFIKPSYSKIAPSNALQLRSSAVPVSATKMGDADGDVSMSASVTALPTPTPAAVAPVAPAFAPLSASPLLRVTRFVTPPSSVSELFPAIVPLLDLAGPHISNDPLLMTQVCIAGGVPAWRCDSTLTPRFCSWSAVFA